MKEEVLLLFQKEVVYKKSKCYKENNASASSLRYNGLSASLRSMWYE